LNIILNSLDPECHVNLHLGREDEEGRAASSSSGASGKWLEACKLARNTPALPRGVQLPVRRREDAFEGDDRFDVNDHCTILNSDKEAKPDEQDGEAASRSPDSGPGTEFPAIVKYTGVIGGDRAIRTATPWVFKTKKRPAKPVSAQILYKKAYLDEVSCTKSRGRGMKEILCTYYIIITYIPINLTI
jgi:hypothetical protein